MLGEKLDRSRGGNLERRDHLERGLLGFEEGIGWRERVGEEVREELREVVDLWMELSTKAL